MKMCSDYRFIFMYKIKFSYEGFCSKIHFERETQGNSELR